MIRQFTVYSCDQCGEKIEVANDVYGGPNAYSNWIHVQMKTKPIQVQQERLEFCKKTCAIEYLMEKDKNG